MPILIRNRAVGDAAAASEDLEAEKGAVGGQNFVVVVEKGADDIGYDAFAARTRDDVADVDAIEVGEFAAQSETPGGIARETAQRLPGTLDGVWRCTQRILVRSQFDHAR